MIEKKGFKFHRFTFNWTNRHISWTNQMKLTNKSHEFNFKQQTTKKNIHSNPENKKNYLFGSQFLIHRHSRVLPCRLIHFRSKIAEDRAHTFVSKHSRPMISRTPKRMSTKLKFHKYQRIKYTLDITKFRDALLHTGCLFASMYMYCIHVCSWWYVPIGIC